MMEGNGIHCETALPVVHTVTSKMEEGLVMENDHFLCEQANVFPLDGFL
jgi:hypothetical protein